MASARANTPKWTPAGAVAPVREADRTRRIAFLLAIILVFFRFSYLHQVQTNTMGGFNLHLLYIFGTPALVGVIVADGLRRAFRGRPAFYWTGYAAWIALAVPFSSWKGGSFSLLLSFLRTDLVMLFAIAGLAVTWRECKALMYAAAWGAVVNLASARLFVKETGGEGRLSLEFGSIANSNDFAAHLLLVLPFLLWIVLSSRVLLLRLMALLGVGYGIYIILSTASRGAAVALAVAILFFLFRGTARQRIALFALAPIVLALVLVAVPKDALQRIVSFSANESGSAVAEEAAASAEARAYVLRKSVEYAIEHPVFGVGPAQFSSYEGGQSVAAGARGYWHDTHNTFTEVASECGIPAMLFFIAGIVSSFRLLNSTWREARRRPDCEDIRIAVFCIMLGMVGFCTAMTFLSLAYTFYLPAMGGMAISIAFAAREEFAAREGGSVQRESHPLCRAAVRAR